MSSKPFLISKSLTALLGSDIITKPKALEMAPRAPQRRYVFYHPIISMIITVTCLSMSAKVPNI
jgi:hypothetical protein